MKRVRIRKAVINLIKLTLTVLERSLTLVVGRYGKVLFDFTPQIMKQSDRNARCVRYYELSLF
jgi:hypothetical protein